jgi:hypothetical protein
VDPALGAAPRRRRTQRCGRAAPHAVRRARGRAGARQQPAAGVTRRCCGGVSAPAAGRLT